MSYLKEYKEKLTTAEAVAADVPSHSMVKYGYFNSKPQMLDRALAARHEELKDVTIMCAGTAPPVPEVIQHKDAFLYQDWHWTALTRILRNYYDNIIYSPSCIISWKNSSARGKFITSGRPGLKTGDGSRSVPWMNTATLTLDLPIPRI